MQENLCMKKKRKHVCKCKCGPAGNWKLFERKNKKKLDLPVIEFVSALSLFAICVAAHDLAEQTGIVLHCKFVPHTVVPEPDHPGSHVIVTLASIIPVKESVAALSELSTCVAGHSF